MVSFSCEVCNDTVIKKKLDQHTQRCRGAYFTCIDCSTTFSGTEYRGHTQCISEAEKYEKALYKGKKAKPTQDEKPAKVLKKVEAVKKVEVEKVEKAKTLGKKVEKKKKEKLLDLLTIANGSLYKAVKAIAKETKQDKKEVLKKLQVKVEDSKVVLTL